MDAKDFAAQVKSGIPAKLQKYVRVAEFMSVGAPVVQVDFAYTDSKNGTDRLNARNFRMLVQGWKKGEDAPEKVSVEAVRSWDSPKLRRRTAQPAKVAQYIVNYLKKAEGDLVKGEPYKKSGSYRLASELSPVVASEVGALGIQVVLAKVFHNEDALRSYLKLHPKADPSKHSVKGKPSKDKKEKGDDKPKGKDKKKPGLKDLSSQPGFGKLKGLSPEKQQEVIERALEMGKPKGDRKPVPKDVSDQFKVLKGLSPREQRKVIERALKMASQQLSNLSPTQLSFERLVRQASAESDPRKKVALLTQAKKVASQHLAGSVKGLEESVKGLKAQVEATKKAIKDFSKNKGDDGKVELVHMYKGRPDKFRMDAKELAKHLKMKERQLKDVSKELEAAKAKKATGKTAQGYRIGPGGLEKPDKGITLQPNTVYWMGASSSPTMIIVTKVTDDSIEYMNPFDKQKRKIQRWIGEDLIMQGSKRWLSSYAKYQPEMAKSIRSMLNGGPGKKEKMRDWDRVRITVRAKDPTQDLWRVAEQYGNVAGIDADDGVMLYEIEGFRGAVEKVKKDSRFKVESEKKIGSRKTSGTTFDSWWKTFREGYGKSSSALKQLEGFFHYRLFDRDGKSKMDGSPVLTPQEVDAAKKSYAKLKKIEKAYEEAWKNIKDFERDVRALDSYMGYS